MKMYVQCLKKFLLLKVMVGDKFACCCFGVLDYLLTTNFDLSNIESKYFSTWYLKFLNKEYIWPFIFSFTVEIKYLL